MSKEKVDVKCVFDDEMAAEYDEVKENHPDLFQSYGQQIFDGGYHEGLSDSYDDGTINGMLISAAGMFVAALTCKFVPKILKKLKK